MNIQALKVAAALLLTAVVSQVSAQELRVGVQNMPSLLDPGRDFSNSGSQYYVNAFDTLIGKDATRQTNVWTPGIATSWTHVSPTEIDLKIRKGVTFHNGDPMTIEDVVFSLDRIINSNFPPYTVRKRDTLPNMAKVKAIDADTIRVTAAKPEPLFEVLLNVQQNMIVPKKYIASLTGDPNVIEPSDYEAFALKPVGTGPYRIAEFVPNLRLVYERFDNYWGEKAPFSRIVVQRIPELSARITALKNGEVDLITNLPPDQIDVIGKDSRFTVEASQTPLFHVVIYNTEHPKMADKRIRQALSLAIDRKTLNDALWFGKAAVPNTFTLPQFGDLYMPDLKTYEYNPEKAKKLLKEAGYDGFTIRFDSFPDYYTNGLLAAQAIQEMWAAVGVKTQLNVTTQWTGADPTMMARNWSNPMYYSDPAGMFGVMWSPTGYSASQNRFKTDQAFDAAWERFRFSTDLAERKKAYVELMERMKDDPPVLPLYQPYEAYAMKKSIKWKPLPGHIPYVLDFRAGHITSAGK